MASTLKCGTWNIQSGGGKRIERICQYIQDLDIDFWVITEFRQKNEGRLKAFFREKGLHYHLSSGPSDNENGVLIASRYDFQVTQCTSTLDPQRWVSVYIPEFDIHILGVHIPGATDNKFNPEGYGVSGEKRKEIFWQDVIAYSKANSIRTVLLGDFNTGLAEDAEGSPFKVSHYMRTLLEIGFVDTWRSLNPYKKDYTWYYKRRSKQNNISKDYNGFRLDYIYVSQDLGPRLISSDILHDARNEKVSDHSIMIMSLQIEGHPPLDIK